MSGGAPKILFVDRDGTLIEEPADAQVDRFEKFRMKPGAIAALKRFVDAGYELVMVSNQDGLGTPAFPEIDFLGPQQLLLDILAGEGVRFREVLVDRSMPADCAPTRKPATGLVRHYLGDGRIDRRRSAVIGDRISDIEFAANIGVPGFRVDADGDWATIARMLIDSPRTGRVERSTRETSLVAAIDLDRPAPPTVSTGIGFFDHMLEQLGIHGGFSLDLRCAGDLAVDQHHTVEDSALALGQAMRAALGERRGIDRYGFVLPMDESLAHATVDLSGRSCFVFDGTFPREMVGELPTELVPHFFGSFVDALGATLHLGVRGENAHHMVEACFKVVGRVLRQAVARGSSGDQVPSSKGILA